MHVVHGGLVRMDDRHWNLPQIGKQIAYIVKVLA